MIVLDCIGLQRCCVYCVHPLYVTLFLFEKLNISGEEAVKYNEMHKIIPQF